MGGKAWTETEIQYLKDNYQTKTSQEMADYLGRSKDSTHLYVNRNIKEKRTRKQRPMDSYANKHEIKIGESIGNLTVKELYYDETKSGTRRFARCECVCGTEVRRLTSDLTRRDNHSCGCKQYKFPEIHGKIKHPAYSHWQKMRERCNNPNYEDYHRYGGRGITICEEWQDAGKFCDWADSNGFKEGLEIERINNDDNYYPKNCMWATDREQANNRSTNRILVIDGESKTVANWSRDDRCQVSESRIRDRLHEGWSHEDAVLVKIGEKPSHQLLPKHQDEIEKKYGRLTVKSIYSVYKYNQNITFAKVECECGNKNPKDIKLTALKSRAESVSCGCIKREKASQRMSNHNQTYGPGKKAT